MPADRPSPAQRYDPPIVVCDIRPDEPTLSAAARLADRDEGWCDAVLIGDHHDRERGRALARQVPSAAVSVGRIHGHVQAGVAHDLA